VKPMRASDVMAELGCSRSRAYEIMAECAHLRFGRSIRISAEAFARWRAAHQVPAWRGSTSGGNSGGSIRGRRTSTKCTDKKAAELAARDAERRRADPTYRPPDATTPLAALRRFVAQQTEREKADGTLKMYDRHIRHIARLLGGHTMLASIGALEVDRYVTTRLKEGATRTSVSKELGTIRGTLKLARRLLQ
jgi:hypothetical protein